MLPRARCALTAPFHPCPSTRARLTAGARTRRYIFCATFLRVAPTGCYPAHCPAEFGLSSLHFRARLAPRVTADSDRLACCERPIVLPAWHGPSTSDFSVLTSQF